MKRRALVVVALLGLCLGVVVTRVVWEGRAALVRGDEAAAAGQGADAVRHWRRAARWYLPGAPHVTGALDRLEALAAEAEAAGDRSLALDAWRGVRGSIFATRSFYTPHAERLAPANEHIAELMAQLEAGAAAEPAPEAVAWHRALLEQDPAPSVGWAVLALLGFALWVGGGFAFALRAVDAEDRLVPRAAAYAGGAVVLGLIVWLVGLHQA